MWYLNSMLFSSSLALSTIIAVSSYTWMGMWLGLEINLLSFIPLISSVKNTYTSESALKYFLTQAIASSILLLSVILLSSNLFILSQSNLPFTIMTISLLLKMGAAPFHFWFPEVIEGLSWVNVSILLTWQKIAPMIVLIYTSKITLILIISVIACMTVSGMMGQNQVSLRKIMAYSSINHIGWMISASLFMKTIWTVYFVVYVVITLNIIAMFKNLSIFTMSQLTLAMNFQPSLKFFFILNFLSLGGLPPLLGFLPKWLTVQLMINENLIFLAFLMIVMTLMTLYFYMRVTFSSIILSVNTSPQIWSSPKNSSLIMIINFISLASLIFSTLVFNHL
nr:NADH dehydrogenase subunit 2 [Homoderus mellyi]